MLLYPSLKKLKSSYPSTSSFHYTQTRFSSSTTILERTINTKGDMQPYRGETSPTTTNGTDHLPSNSQTRPLVKLFQSLGPLAFELQYIINSQTRQGHLGEQGWTAGHPIEADLLRWCGEVQGQVEGLTDALRGVVRDGRDGREGLN